MHTQLDRSWRGLDYATVFVLAAVAVALFLIATGMFDPRPAGPLVWESALSAITVPPEGQTVHWLPDTRLPPPPYTIRLTAAWRSGESDSAFGLALGGNQDFVGLAISPLGNVALAEKEALIGPSYSPSATGWLLPWQTWPHVRLDTETNELWVDVEQDALRVRINRELLTEMAIAVPGDQVGLWLRSFRGPVTVDFQRLELLAPGD